MKKRYAVPGKSPSTSSKSEFHIDPDLTAGQAVTRIYLTLLQAMLNNEAGIRTHSDPDFLHDFRVAVRRTRAALTQIKSIYPHEIVSPIREEFAWLGQETGPLRDLDVFLLKIVTFKMHLPKGMRPFLDPLYQFLQANQQVEYHRLLQTLDSARYRRLMKNWHGILTAPEIVDNPATDDGRANSNTGAGRYWRDFHTVLDRSSQQSLEKRSINMNRPIGDVASERIWRVYRRVYKQGCVITENTPAEALHHLRIECKKLRYLLEFFQSLYKPSLIGLLTESLKKLQDNLGNFNDYEVQQNKLNIFSADMKQQRRAPAETFLAIDHLIEYLKQSQAKERVRFQKCFAEFSKQKNRNRFRNSFKK